MQLEIIINSIEDAIKKQCFLPALALTLVIPDICAQFEYRDLHKKSQGKAYAKWYDKNIAEYDLPDYSHLELDEQDKKEFSDLANTTALSGKNLWYLRCSFLHEASIDLNAKMSHNGKKVCFNLTSSKYSGCNILLGAASCAWKNDDAYYVNIDIAQFCGKILAVLKNSYLTNPKFVEFTDKKNLNYKEEMLD